jgi:hypothetical protein
LIDKVVRRGKKHMSKFNKLKEHIQLSVPKIDIDGVSKYKSRCFNGSRGNFSSIS